MSKTIAIIVTNDNILKLNQSNLNYLISELNSLNYAIKKVSLLPSDKNLLTFETEHLLKQNDFVILIRGPELSLINASIAEVFNLVTGGQNHKLEILKYSKCLTYNDLPDFVLYFNRLFIIADTNLNIIYDKILRRYLQQFNEEKPFTKEFILNHDDIIDFDDGLQINTHREGKMLIVQVQSPILKPIIEYESFLNVKFPHMLQRAVMENIYNDFCFPHIIQAINCVEKCFDEYGPENVFVCFNGGKDCTVMLHLVLSVLKEKYPEYTNRVVCMYVQSTNPFVEVNNFIDNIRQFYNLEVLTITKGIKEALAFFLNEKSNMKACFMGTRRSDPFSEHLKAFQMTDVTWPQVMRISPLLDWHYSDIWDYLLYYHITYCCLYDEGYTSLGSLHNTIKNPDLLYGTSKGDERYMPAYKLLDGSKERSGRT